MVEPPKPSHRGRNIIFMMVATVAALGIAGAVMTKRSSMQALMEEDTSQPEQETAAKSETNSHAHMP